MEVNFQLEPEDIAAFQKFHGRHYGSRWPMILVLVIGLVTPIVPQLLGRHLRTRLQIFGFAGVLRQITNNMARLFANAGALLSFLIPLVFFLLFWFFLIPRLTRSSIQKTDAYKTRQIVRLSERGLFQSQDSGDFLYRWTHIFSVVDEAAHIFLMINKSTAVVVPKRAFANSQDAQQFYETALNYWKSNQNAIPPIPSPPTGN